MVNSKNMENKKKKLKKTNFAWTKRVCKCDYSYFSKCFSFRNISK